MWNLAECDPLCTTTVEKKLEKYSPGCGSYHLTNLAAYR